MTPTPEQIGVFILCLLAFIPLVDAVKRWFGKPQRRDIQQPFQVVAAPHYVELADCEKMHRAQEATFNAEFRGILQEELRKMEETHTRRTEEFRKELRGDIGGVHRRVDLLFKHFAPGLIE